MSSIHRHESALVTIATGVSVEGRRRAATEETARAIRLKEEKAIKRSEYS